MPPQKASPWLCSSWPQSQDQYTDPQWAWSATGFKGIVQPKHCAIIYSRQCHSTSVWLSFFQQDALFISIWLQKTWYTAHEFLWMYGPHLRSIYGKYSSASDLFWTWPHHKHYYYIIMQCIQNSAPNSLLFIMHGNEVRLNWAYLPSAKLISARTWVQLPYETRNAKALPFSPFNVELQEKISRSAYRSGIP